MKSKIIYLTIGIVIGIIISSASFYIYNKTVLANRRPDKQQMDQTLNDGNPPQRPDEENSNTTTTTTQATNTTIS